MVDDQRVRVRDIKASFDDRGAHQHVDVPVPEVANHLVELLLTHLAMRDADVAFGHELVDLVRHGGDVLHAVVHVEHLPAAQQFAPHRGGDLRVLVRAHVGEHGQSVLRGRGQRGHLADARDRHLQRARDGRGRQAQHVDVRAQRLERLLVFHAETLLLVDDDQAEIFELDLRAEQLVRADHHVHGAFGEPFGGLLDLLGLLEAAHRGHVDGESLIAFGERLVMLLNQQRGGHEHGDLLAVLHRLERGSHGDLGFAEADVAADQAVHGPWLLHVGLHVVDGGELVGGLLVRERVLKLLLPRGVRAEREAGRALAGRIQFHQVVGDLAHMLARLGLGRGPVGAAELVELGGFGADVLAHQVELVGGNEQFVRRGAALARRVFDDQVFACGRVRAGADGALAHLHETADAVLLVHHVVAGLELHQVDGLAAAFRGFGACGGAGATGQVAFGEQRDLRLRVDETVDGGGTDGVEARDTRLIDGAFEPCERALRGCGDGDRVAFVDQSFDACRGLAFVTAVFAGRFGGEAHAARAGGVHVEIGQFDDVVVGIAQ